MAKVWADSVRKMVWVLVIGLWANILLGSAAFAVQQALHLMDARTGETLYAKNADTPQAPASLTKMMTLYITFQEIEAGHVTLDTMITVSKNAANQAPSKLGLKAGQKIALRYLIRAAAVKSANDAAAAIGDHFAGSPEKWGARMTATAKKLGMKHSTFKNAIGLPAKGHLSTARDMSILGRHLFYDFPQYYNIFSRRSTDAGVAKVASTNRKFLDAYEGADGIKTGFTNSAGFCLTASAERNGVRLIGTILGGLLFSRLGMNRSLWLFALVGAAGNLGYWALAQFHGGSTGLLLAVGLENLGGGLVGAAFVALLMSLCNPRFSATQYALLSGVYALSRSVLSGQAGFMAQGIGWSNFFLLTAAASLPAFLLMAWLTPWHGNGVKGAFDPSRDST